MTNTAFFPVIQLSDLLALDSGDVAQGYRDGWVDNDEPGHNHGRAYWHGWRCAQMDRGRMPIPETHRQLTAEYVAHMKRERKKRDQS
jgi:hypothetical protein